MTHAEITETTRLDSSTVRTAVRHLTSLGLVVTDEEGYVRLHGDAATLVGVDLTLARAEIAVADLDMGLRKSIERRPVDELITDPHQALDVVAQMIAEEIEAAEVDVTRLMGVAIGLPGPISRRTGASDSPHILSGWEGVPIRDGLVRRLAAYGLEGVDAVVANDASLGALGAYTRGRFLNPLAAPEDLLYVRISVGVGGGLVLKGHSVTGATGLAGEIGHVRVTPHGPLCTRCNQRGCLEQMSSAAAVLEAIRRERRENERPVPVSLRAALRQPNAETLDHVKAGGWHLGMVLAGVVNVLNPSAIVLGGWLAEQPAYHESVRATLRRYALEPLSDDVEVMTWTGMPEALVGTGTRGRLDSGEVFSPELLGALSYVIDELGDKYLLTQLGGGPRKRGARVAAAQGSRSSSI